MFCESGTICFAVYSMSLFWITFTSPTLMVLKFIKEK